jgi:MOSC domain-containing protein YiiM
MRERILSLNLGTPVSVPHRDRAVATAIFKGAVDGPALLRADGFVGDVQADLRVHGGPQKAAYVYSQDSYDWWMEELGHRLAPGEFGENLTVTGLTDEVVHVGDRFRVGTALTEVTMPRVPCFKLGIRMGDPRFPKRFARANRRGFYLRVLEEGEVAAGNAIERVHHEAGAPAIAEVQRPPGRSSPDEHVRS